jgi:predicted MFS family arabinose efflux permease
MGLVALLSSGTLPTVWTRMVNALFDRSRGLALGIVLSGSSLFAAFGPALAQRLIEALGWRAAWLVLALLPLAVAWPLAWAWFKGADRPAPGATTQSAEPAAAVEPRDTRAALRNYRFWVLTAGFTLVTLGVGGLNPNLVPMLGSKGFTPAEAAGVMGAFGLSMGVGRISIGLVIDRVWAPGVAAVVLALPAASALLLLGQSVSTGQALLAVALLGFAQGAEYDFLAYLVARYFGMSHYGRIYGLVLLPIVVATSVGAVSVARARDLTGSFDAALPVVAALFAAGAVSLLVLGRYPRVAQSGR